MDIRHTMGSTLPLLMGLAGALSACGTWDRDDAPTADPSSLYLTERPSTARTLHFTVEVEGLPRGLGLFHPPRAPGPKFWVWANRETGQLTIDSYYDDQRWQLGPSQATHADDDRVTDVDDATRDVAQVILKAALDEFAGCTRREGVVPADHGFTKQAPTGITWTSVDCAWFPPQLPTMLVGYAQFPPEPPQIARVWLQVDDRPVRLSLSRIVYDLPLPASTRGPVKRAPEQHHIAPLRPGATDVERREHERIERRRGIE